MFRLRLMMALCIVLTLLGVISFMTLPVTRFPNIDVPLVSITVVQSGAAPAELESQVTKYVEDAVANITGVKHIMSTVTDGQSQTVIEFRLEVNQDRAVNDVKDAEDGTHFAVNIIPHTAKETTLGALTQGQQLNVEIDVIARYIDRMMVIRAQ